MVSLRILTFLSGVGGGWLEDRKTIIILLWCGWAFLNSEFQVWGWYHVYTSWLFYFNVALIFPCPTPLPILVFLFYCSSPPVFASLCLALVSLWHVFGRNLGTRSKENMADEKAVNGELSEDELKADEYKLEANQYFKGMIV